MPRMNLGNRMNSITYNNKGSEMRKLKRNAPFSLFTLLLKMLKRSSSSNGKYFSISQQALGFDNVPFTIQDEYIKPYYQMIKNCTLFRIMKKTIISNEFSKHDKNIVCIFNVFYLSNCTKYLALIYRFNLECF